MGPARTPPKVFAALVCGSVAATHLALRFFGICRQSGTSDIVKRFAQEAARAPAECTAILLEKTLSLHALVSEDGLDRVLVLQDFTLQLFELTRNGLLFAKIMEVAKDLRAGESTFKSKTDTLKSFVSRARKPEAQIAQPSVLSVLAGVSEAQGDAITLLVDILRCCNTSLPYQARDSPEHHMLHQPITETVFAEQRTKLIQIAQSYLDQVRVLQEVKLVLNEGTSRIEAEAGEPNGVEGNEMLMQRGMLPGAPPPFPHPAPDTPGIGPMSNMTLFQRLNAIDVGPDSKRHQDLYHKGTRSWVFQKLEAWEMDENAEKAFWIDGTGGLGKSVIVAEYLRRCNEACKVSHQQRAVAVFFCRHNDAARSNVQVAIGTLAFQLAQQLPTFKDAINAAMAAEGENALSALLQSPTASVDDLFKAMIEDPLNTMQEQAPAGLRITLIVDALDEMSKGTGRTALLKMVGALFPRLPPFVRVLVTARPEDDILRHFENLRALRLTKTTETGEAEGMGESAAMQEAQREDIELYFRDTLAKLQAWKTIGAAKKKSLIKQLLDSTDGVFLAARLAMERATELAQEPGGLTEESFQRVCTVKLDGMYQETLERIVRRLDESGFAKPAQEVLRHLLQRILGVLASTKASLRADDVAEMASANSNEISGLFANQLLQALSLMFARDSAGVVEPIHKTVTDFLKDRARSGPFWADEAEGSAALACSTARVMRLWLERDWRRPERDELLRHALLYGHQYLTRALANQARTKLGQQALQTWTDLLLETRATHPSTIPGPSLSTLQASALAGYWTLAQAHLPHGRGLRLRPELLETVNALKSEPDLRRFFNDFRKLFAAFCAHADGAMKAEALIRLCSARPGPSPLNSTAWQDVIHACVLQGEPPAATMMQLDLPLRTSLPLLELNLRGHVGAVLCVAVSCDGSKIASGGEDATICVWDSCTGALIHVLQGHDKAVVSVAFRQQTDGKDDDEREQQRDQLASASDDTTVRLWDAGTGRAIDCMTKHTEPVMKVCFMGKDIVSGARTIYCWCQGKPRQVRKLKKGRYPVLSLAASPNGDLLGCLRSQGLLSLWNTSRKLVTLPQTGSDILKLKAISLSSHRKIFGLTTDSGETCLLEMDIGDKPAARVVDIVSYKFHSIVGTLLATSSTQPPNVATADQAAIMLHSCDGAQLRKPANIEAHTRTITDMCFLPDGFFLCSSSNDGTVKVWDTGLSGTAEESGRMAGHPGEIVRVALSPDCSKLASLCNQGTLIVWDGGTGQLQKHMDAVDVRCLDMDNTGRLVGGTSSGLLRVWESDGKGIMVPEELPVHSPVECVALSWQVPQAACGFGDGELQLWDISARALLWRVQANRAAICSVAITCDGSRVASVSADNAVREWATTTLAPGCLEGRMEFESAAHDLRCVYFTSKGQSTLYGCKEEKLQCRDPRGTGSLGSDLPGLGSATVRFADDQRLRVAAHAGGTTFQLWIARLTPKTKELVNTPSLETSAIWVCETMAASGAFGEVWKGKLGCEPVCLKIALKSGEAEEHSQNEFQFLSKFKHERLVSFLGNGVFPEDHALCALRGRSFLAFELLENGPLSDRLMGDHTLDWEAKLQVLEDVARGMDFLHSEAGWVHRDLKPSNILLTKHLRAKVADFGLAEQLPKSKQGSKSTAKPPRPPCGTPIYMPPEELRKEPFTKAGDVFSFGQMLWEVAVEHRPDPMKELETEFRDGPYLSQLLAFWETGKRLTFDEHRGHLPPGCGPEYEKTYFQCVDGLPPRRPTFESIAVDLQRWSRESSL